MSRKIIYFLVRLILNSIARVRIIGLEKLPLKEGSSIIVSNHLGVLDAFVVYYTFSRLDVIIFVAEKYQEHAITRWMAKLIDGVFVDRYGADFRAMREVYQRLRKGGVLVIAPEGTRSPTRGLIQGRQGAAYLASKTGLPVFPGAITGSEDELVVKRLRRLKRLDLKIKVGDPFTIPPLPKENREDALKTYTDEIMCQIAALLPPDYRGVYAEHPRLKELLSSKSGMDKEVSPIPV